MKSLTIKKLYTLHTWVGILSGVLLFIIAFTGALAVFSRPELTVWASPTLRTPVPFSADAWQRIIDEHAQRVEPHFLDEIHVRLPSARNEPQMRVIYEGHVQDASGHEIHDGVVYEFSPRSLNEIRQTDRASYFDNPHYNVAGFIAQFHADLHLGRPLGLILTGLLGLTLMISIVTGFYIHRKKLVQLFTFRPSRSFSLMLNDSHKVMGVWGLLFHLTISFTGAFLGLATVILVPAAAYVGFNGDQEKLVDTFTAIKPPILAHVAQPTQVSAILKAAQADHPQLTLDRLTIMGYGDKNALVYVFGYGGEQLGGETLVYEGATATFLQSQANFGRLEGVTGKILDAMFPLHFGNFAGVLVKIIWCWLGLTLALLPVSGIMLWVERGLTAKNAAYSPRTYEGAKRLLVVGCCGVVFSSALLLPLQIILNTLEQGRALQSENIFSTFFISWMIVSLTGCCMPAAWSFRLLGWLTAVVLLSVLPLDGIMQQVIATGDSTALTVDIVALLLGAALVRYLLKSRMKAPQLLPSARQEEM